jgi:hypothetical protein
MLFLQLGNSLVERKREERGYTKCKVRSCVVKQKQIVDQQTHKHKHTHSARRRQLASLRVLTNRGYGRQKQNKHKHKQKHKHNHNHNHNNKHKHTHSAQRRQCGNGSLGQSSCLDTPQAGKTERAACQARPILSRVRQPPVCCVVK